jgi:hypothetical protein
MLVQERYYTYVLMFCINPEYCMCTTFAFMYTVHETVYTISYRRCTFPVITRNMYNAVKQK